MYGGYGLLRSVDEPDADETVCCMRGIATQGVDHEEHCDA